MRLFITTLSLLSMISFGYALAGYGGTLFGRELNLEYIVGGLICGILFAAAALILWYFKKEDFYDEV